jgi:hypothetical protein
MRMNLMLAIVLGCAWSIPGSANDKKGQPAESAELKVLDRFVGNWDMNVTISVSEGKPKEIKLTGTATIQWSLGGRFLQWKGSSTSGRFEDLQLLTYDAGRKTYRHWYFSSEGVADESAGKWDEATKTMTWKGDVGDGRTLLNVVRLTDKDTQEFNLVVKDRNGKAVTEIKGKMTRK